MNYNYNPDNAVTRDDMKRIEDAARRRSAPRRSPADKDTSEHDFHTILTVLVWPLFTLYLELVLRLLLFGKISGRQFAYSVLFSFSAGLLCAVLTSFFNVKVNYILTLVISGFFSVYFNVQLIYYKSFSMFFYWGQLSLAGNAASYWREALATIFANWYGIILLFIPFILYCIFGKKYLPPQQSDWALRGVSAVLAFVFLLGGNGFVSFHNDEYDDKYYYGSGFIMSEAANRFGTFAALRLDTKYTLFGTPKDDTPHTPVISTVDQNDIFQRDTTASTTSPTNPSTSGNSQSETDVPDPPKPVDTSPNVLDIDFDSLIAGTSNKELKNAHEYFKNLTPTNKNKYTGLFKGKNLILITVEAWANAAIDPKLTPTLYKMKNEGFVFENYYCSCDGGSTASGEYAILTGNFVCWGNGFNPGTCLRTSADKLMKFTAGNMFRAAGYQCYGFHDHSYTFYSRDKSHPNFGYDWYGIGNWDATFTYPNCASDRELALNTLDYLTPDKPFHVYYMTYSGHRLQTWGGNMNAQNHKNEILSAGLNYTDQNALSYIAAQYEVELMVKTLIEDLDRKGILEDTVFVMAPDHYPYQITSDANESYSALSDLFKIPLTSVPGDIEGNFDLYRAPLIIWSASMKEPVKVEKVCAAVDILPTILNLFGMDFDSRLLTGRDILSDNEGFVVLNCTGEGGSWHWITDNGSYNTKTRKFTPAPGVTISGDISAYLKQCSSVVSARKKYSPYILSSDYYRMVFPNG